MIAHHGAVVWLTGIPGSGKSAVAREVERILLRRGARVELLDGPEVRRSLSRGLGFSREDREENVRRIGYVAKLLARNGVIAICASISPYRATREEVRRNVANFVEVFVDCPIEVAEARDDEGLYARARRGELGEFTGVNAPYEPPESPEVHVRSDRVSPEQGARDVIHALERLGIIPPATDDSGALEEEIRRRLASLGYS